MKKSITSIALIFALIVSLFALSSCDLIKKWFGGDDNGTDDPAATIVEVTGSDGLTVNVAVNPTRVAVYDYAILDILDNVGFDNTGIVQLIVPSKTTLPADLDYYKNQPDSKVVSGGSLFYVDWDALDIVQPQLVILGGRSFGMNAAGERLGAEDNAAFKSSTMARYSSTAFVKLSVNSSNSNLAPDLQSNVTALGKIFPSLKPALDAKLAEILAAMDEIKVKAQASGKKALFCMMVDQTTLSVFNTSSRFDMLYEEFGFEAVDADAAAWSEAHGFTAQAEYVLARNPDVIFVLDRSATVGTGAGYQNFLADSSIQATDAYKNGNIYNLTGEAWYTMTGGFTAITRMISDINQFFAA
ncbi:MAG: ABC transporter substrate-binding protein [Clostridiales bacterium]|jgi:iron complex transport system substrate-binding protein|nr:ABC transporter substrate-binding protein [Clostridiales bacterium]